MANDLLVDLRQLIRGTLQFTHDFERRRIDEPPLRTSAVARELAAERSFAGPWYQQPLTAIHALAGLRVVVAADHLQSLSALLGASVPAFSDLTLVRGTLESSARAWWLYDPALNPKERFARGMTEWAYSEYRAQQVIRIEKGDDRSRLDRIDKMVLAAEQYGIPVVRERGKPPAFWQRRAETTALVKSMMGKLGEAAWRWTSSVTHGELLGIMSRTGAAPSERFATGLVAEARPRPIDELYHLAYVGLRAHQEAYDLRCEHHGWDTTEWEIWKRHVAQTLARPGTA